ncbi:glycoside hydrolase family 79 protein [Collybiopsis luxurians FD-317 M1]|uniref:Glycoside hydrolase family 79 protein n=1 Tax=Collybiopsis luxurians FD-317 M1 TaxID=944289 RepID=A0A0D0BGX0_9AGAR|nr:glycoside hydrolase family 79 protein [Collybiopsis luxurians FD-317 M1]
MHVGLILYAMQIQPIALYCSILDGSSLPSPLPPHVQPQYYAAIVVAEAIGKSGNTRLSELSVESDQISGYIFYEGSQAKRMFLINHTPYFQADSQAGSARSVINVKF